jgi:MFS transporter, SP family, sugar:H+ symporter
MFTDSTLIVTGAGVPFLPQSPRQSILNDHPEDARSVIARMHAIPLDDPLVQAYMDEIAAKIIEEKVSGAGYLDCFNFKNDLKTGQRTLIGYVLVFHGCETSNLSPYFCRCCVQSFQQLTG